MKQVQDGLATQERLACCEQESTVWNRTFICAMLCQLFIGLSQYIVNPLVSSYAAYLGAGPKLVGLLTGLYFGVSLLLRPVTGPALVRLDKKILLFFVFGMGIIVNFLYATFDSIPMFIAVRVLHGVQFGLVGSLLITIAGDSLPKEKMGSGLGLFGIGNALSMTLGPTIGLAIRSWGSVNYGEGGGYRAIFYTAAGIMVFSLIPCFLARPKKCSKEEIAAAGAWYKNIIALPSIPCALCNMFFSIAYSLLNAYMVPYSVERGFSGISMFFTIYALVLLVSRPVSGRLTDKFGPTAIIYPGAALLVVGFLLIWRAQSMTAVYIAAVISSLGYGSAYPAFQSACLQSMPPVRRGVASNTNYVFVDLGLFIGPTLGGLVISHYLETGHAYSTLYLYGIIPLILAVVVLTVFRKYIKCRLKEVADICG